MTDEISTPRSTPPRILVAIVAGAFLVVAIALVIQTWHAGRPVTLPSASDGTLQCASYTPSHNGHVLGVAETRKLVADDLKILAKQFHCVRTYSVSEGLDDVPKIARELGLKVMLGLWISSHAPSNDKEIAHGVALANEYSDVVTAIIVGNEVLLRREQSGAQLRDLIKRVRSQTRVPVTYADVWEFWLRNAELANVTDFVTIHILPYWEDNPIGIDHALDHVKNIFAKVQNAFPGRKIFIGETGWPSAGRPRLQAVPSLLNEARFIREFSAYAEREKIPYNIIEAFDQPWKRAQEGTVGGYWGLYDAEGAAKFPFTGSLSARPTWRIDLSIALGGAALFALAGYLWLRPFSARSLSFLAIAGHAAGSILTAQWQYATTANRTTLEWVATSTWSASGWLVYVFACWALARWLEDSSQVRQPASFTRCIASLGYGAASTRSHNDNEDRLLGFFRALLVFGTMYVCLGHVYEGRGRDFPIMFIALPTLALFALRFVELTKTTLSVAKDAGNEELLAAICLIGSSLFIVWHETTQNLRALGWSVLCILLGITLLRFSLQIAQSNVHPHERTEHESSAA